MHSSHAVSANGKRWRYDEEALKSPLENIPNFATFEARLAPLLGSLPDYTKSVQRLADAVERKETIGISSDYDCDGNCSLAVLLRTLKECGVPEKRLVPHVPNRFTEGYGVNDAAVKKMHAEGASLLVTLDNGTLAHRPLAQAKALRMDVIVADHHPNQLGEPLPEGALIVNANRTDATVADPALKNLAAVGMTYLLCLGVVKELEQRGYFAKQKLPVPDMEKHLGLVGLATVADVVPVMSWINRFFIRAGLDILREKRDPALVRLCEAAQVIPERLRDDNLGFLLGPVVNAPGRLNSPDDAEWHDAPEPWRLLSLVDPASAEAQNGFIRMKQCNEARKEKEASLFKVANTMALVQLDEAPDSRVLVVGGEGEPWNPGVVGIVASRLMEHYGLPTIVAAYDTKKQLWKASGRSIRALDGETLVTADLGQAIRDEKSAGRLAHGGGHPAAAGFTLECPPEEKDAALKALRLRLDATMGKQVDTVQEIHRTPVADLLHLPSLKRDTLSLDDPVVRARALSLWLRDLPQHTSVILAAQKLTGMYGKPGALGIAPHETNLLALDPVIRDDIGDARKNALAVLNADKSRLLPAGGEAMGQLRALCRRVEERGPFGEGNRAPLFQTAQMMVRDLEDMGSARHLRLTLQPVGAPDIRLLAQAFHVSPKLRQALEAGRTRPIEILGSLNLKEEKVCVRIEDAYVSPKAMPEPLVAAEQILENFPFTERKLTQSSVRKRG